MVLPTTRGTIMTTLTDDLNLALRWAQVTYPSTPVEIVNDMVYVNYAFRSAVVIDVHYDDERGKLWNADVCHWDASGGIDEDLFIADGTLGLVLDRVALFLMQESVKTEKLERLLDQRPEDM